MDNINTVLTNDLANQVYNSNVAYNNSWIGVAGAGYPLFAQASYITNFDSLKISLSTNHVTIGDVNLADPITGLNANIVQVSLSAAALRVLTQDLDSVHDSFTIGDQNGKYAIITNSALNVFQTNPVSAVSVTNTVNTIVIETNPTALRTFNNFDNAFSINNTKIPVFAVRINPNSGSTGYIRNYSILTGSSPGTVVLGYTWVQNPSAIGGSYTWNNLLSSNLQYTIFSEQPSSNSYSGGVAVHSGLVAESNLESGDEISAIPLTDGSSPTVLLLAAQRLDASGTTDFWFTVDVAQN